MKVAMYVCTHHISTNGLCRQQETASHPWSDVIGDLQLSGAPNLHPTTMPKTADIPATQRVTQRTSKQVLNKRGHGGHTLLHDKFLLILGQDGDHALGRRLLVRGHRHGLVVGRRHVRHPPQCTSEEQATHAGEVQTTAQMATAPTFTPFLPQGTRAHHHNNVTVATAGQQEGTDRRRPCAARGWGARPFAGRTPSPVAVAQRAWRGLSRPLHCWLPPLEGPIQRPTTQILYRPCCGSDRSN